MEFERASEPYCRSRVVLERLFEQPLTVKQDERRMARFAQYAMVAAEEALQDAGWNPKNENSLEATVLMYRYCSYVLYLHSRRVFTWAPESVA